MHVARTEQRGKIEGKSKEEPKQNRRDYVEGREPKHATK